MGSTTALWFHIDTTFAEIEQLCIEARATELAMRRATQEKMLMRSFAGKRTVVDEETILEVEPRYAQAAELAKDIKFRENHSAGVDLVEVRARVRKRLTWLKTKLSEVLAEHEVYYSLFPIVVYSDELIHAATRGATERWEPLQSELYEIDNGGELFYSILDDRLKQEETHPLIFEVFYFCLSDGFLGMYQKDSQKIEEYKALLARRVPQPAVEVDAAVNKEPTAVELVDFPWRYYAAAGGLVLASYLLLSWSAP